MICLTVQLITATYHSILHRVSQHYPNPFALPHPYRFQAPGKRIAFGIKRGVGDTVVLMLRDDTSKEIVMRQVG